RVEQRHGEVEDHEVMPVADTLDPPDQLTAHTLEACLLGQLPDDGLGQQLPGLHPSAWHRPVALRGTATSADEQQPSVLDDDGTDAHLRCGGQMVVVHGSGRCTTMARATRPTDSRKVLASRFPGATSE